MSKETFKRVAVTDGAKEIIDQLRDENGELMFHQSGGCCDGSQPMCFTINEFKLGSSDVKLGEIHGCGFYMGAKQFEYWKHTHLTIDVTKGRGSSFSLEIPLGVRFMTLSRLYTKEEEKNLQDIEYCT